METRGLGFDEAQALITGSDRADWNVISCFGLPSSFGARRESSASIMRGRRTDPM